MEMRCQRDGVAREMTFHKDLLMLHINMMVYINNHPLRSKTLMSKWCCVLRVPVTGKLRIVEMSRVLASFLLLFIIIIRTFIFASML